MASPTQQISSLTNTSCIIKFLIAGFGTRIGSLFLADIGKSLYKYIFLIPGKLTARSILMERILACA